MKKRPKDPSQLAKLIVDIASGQVEDKQDAPPKKKIEKNKITKTKKK